VTGAEVWQLQAGSVINAVPTLRASEGGPPGSDAPGTVDVDAST
jgi:hypothetical protein